MGYRTAFCTLIVCAAWMASARAHDDHAASGKTIHAVRAVGEIRIDGRLDDPSWAYASPAGDFVQREPEQGVAPTESTHVQIVYDDEAIYFGVTLFDSEPHRIAKRLARRDRAWDGDWFFVSLDPYHDHRSGYFFVVNAAGIEGDGLLFNDNNNDSDWDGVWDSAVRITDTGWVVEMKIPYHTIRFTRQDTYVWGVNFVRAIHRKNEEDQWSLVRRDENGWVSRFGHIEGIEHIRPPMRLQTVPYALSEGQFAPVGPRTPEGNALNQRIGGDVKYGLTSNMTLDMTVNPDFGQVEADEAVLNLSTFETFFPEKRPFFLEGAQIFDTEIGLFYSRRIGRSPTGSFDNRDGDAVLVENPTATNILGAAKITGRTQAGTTIGVLSAVTAKEYATLQDTVEDVRYRDLVEPRAMYNVVRLKRDILNNSFVGLIATNATYDGRMPASTGGVDWRLNFLNNMYNFRGQVALSRAGQGARKTGMGTEISFSKQGGDHIGGNLFYSSFSPDFDINDLGFLRQSNIHRLNGWFTIRGNHDWKFTRRRFLNFNSWNAWNYDGDKLEQGGNVNVNIGLKNWWWTGAGYGRNAPTFDDRETRGNGLIERPGTYFAWWWLQSDFRRRVAAGLNLNWGEERDGRFWNIGVFSRFQVKNNIELRIGPQYRRSRDVSRWVANVDDPANPDNQIPVFGELDTDNFSVVTRANITFTKDLSFSFYNQVFFAAGDYTGFKRLTSPTTFGPLTSGVYTGNPDFNSRSMNINAVLRWEYRPGSALFLVWSQARQGQGIPGDAAFGRNLRGIFDAPSENFLLMKLSYWWNV